MKRRIFINSSGWSKRAAARLRSNLSKDADLPIHLAFHLQQTYVRLTQKLRDYPEHKSIKQLLDIAFGILYDIVNVTHALDHRSINNITEIAYYLGRKDMQRAAPIIIGAAAEFPDQFPLIIGAMCECTNIHGDYENFKRRLDGHLDMERRKVSLSDQAMPLPLAPAHQAPARF